MLIVGVNSNLISRNGWFLQTTKNGGYHKFNSKRGDGVDKLTHAYMQYVPSASNCKPSI